MHAEIQEGFCLHSQLLRKHFIQGDEVLIKEKKKPQSLDVGVSSSPGLYKLRRSLVSVELHLYMQACLAGDHTQGRVMLKPCG